MNDQIPDSETYLTFEDKIIYAHQRNDGAFYKSYVKAKLHRALTDVQFFSIQEKIFCTETVCINDWDRHVYECPITREALEFVHECFKFVDRVQYRAQQTTGKASFENNEI